MEVLLQTLLHVACLNRVLFAHQAMRILASSHKIHEVLTTASSPHNDADMGIYICSDREKQMDQRNVSPQDMSSLHIRVIHFTSWRVRRSSCLYRLIHYTVEVEV